MLVTLIPIVSVGIKHVGNDTGALTMFHWDCPTTLDVEVVVGLMVVLSGYVGYRIILE